MSDRRQDRTAAERQRRRRQRRHGGFAPVTVDVRVSELQGVLFALGYIAEPTDIGYRAQLRRALEDALEDLSELGELPASHRDAPE